MRPTVFSIAFLATGFLAAPLVASVVIEACSGSGGSDGGADGNPYGNPTGPCRDGTIQMLSCTQTIEGGAPLETFSDEACLGLDTAEARTGLTHDSAQAPAMDQPAEGATLPATPPFTFAWHPTGLAWRLRRAPARRFTWRDDLTRWAALVPAAEAHCPAFGGVGYAVIFRTHGQQLLRSNTAHTYYQPTPDAWARLRAARGTIEMTVEAARFSNNTVTEGPYDQATPRHFTIAP
jgi:hypothetical protein